MPTFKHPCPYCDKFIDRAVAACPFCGVADPFAPKRCLNCRKIVEDPAWVVCPSCGQSLIAPPPPPAGTAAARSAAAGTAGNATGAASGAAVQAPPPPRPSLFKDTQAAETGAAPAPASPAGGKCSGCGAPMPAGARFCTICGTMAG
jgi:RNA polymerase subunit RPABC4/transcription elongation factor Spt4